MEKLISIASSKQLDIDSQNRYKINPLILMEQAGTRAYTVLIEFLNKKNFDEKRIVFVVGGGNNGGDALVMARLAYLDNYKDFFIVMVNPPSSSLCLEQFNICINLKLPIINYFDHKNRTEQKIKEANIIVDGITGLGLKNPLRKDLADIIISINQQKAKGSFVTSIDVPSGLSEETTKNESFIVADLTITMGLKKVFAYHDKFREAWGEIICVNPSFALELLEEVEKEAILIDESDLKLNRVSESAYKNVRGHLALFAGSVAYSGAARLTSKAAFTSGLGLVTLFCDKEIYSAVGYESPSVIIRTLEEFETTNFNQKYQAIVAGPGWGKNREKILLNLLNCKLPIILDADANSRNLASGALRRLKSSETAAFPLKMFVYDAYFEDKRENSLTHLQLLSFLVDLGFTVNPSLALFSKSGEKFHSSIKGVEFGLLNQLPAYIEKKGEQRDALPYEIDGLVIKVNEIEIRTLLGSTSHHPRWALAYKFEAPEAQSVVNSIDVQIGRTGRVTPVARIESVRVGNSVVSNVTLHNQTYIDMLELAIGDRVAVSKRGDVIPAIERVVDKNEQGNSTWKMSANCPVCHTLLVEVGAHTFCPNEMCPQQVLGSLIFFAGKNQMDIEGFGSETVTYLYENNLIKEISDLYKVDYDALIGEPGFQKKKVDSLKKGIAKSKEQPFRKVLISLGIEDFGKNGVDLIVDNGITTIDKLLELVDNDKREEFLAIKGLGEKTVDSLFKSLKKESLRNVIKQLKEFGLQMEEEIKDVNTALPFKDQIWCVTGSFETFSPRSLAEREIEKRGGKVTSSLSKNTTFLLAGEKAGSKLQQAIKLGTTVVDEKQFIEMVEAQN
jgi:NAD-dependent DNA ligase